MDRRTQAGRWSWLLAATIFEGPAVPDSVGTGTCSARHVDVEWRRKWRTSSPVCILIRQSEIDARPVDERIRRPARNRDIPGSVPWRPRIEPGVVIFSKTTASNSEPDIVGVVEDVVLPSVTTRC